MLNYDDVTHYKIVVDEKKKFSYGTDQCICVKLEIRRKGKNYQLLAERKLARLL